jgi:PAS domain S-box-containing protein|tara:strand:- start:417 stop:1004 length:588 start_codon:yes stop_codon:yes gene_type:complete
MDKDIFFDNANYTQFQLKLIDLLESEEIAVDDVATSILEYLPLGISIVAKDGTYLYVNQLYCKKLGYRAEDLVLKKTSMDITTDMAPEKILKNLEIASIFGTARRGVGVYNLFKKTWRHAEGGEVTGVCKASRFYFKKGGVPCVVAAVAFEEVAGDADLILDVGPRSHFGPRTIKYHLQMIQSLLKNRFKRMLNL